MVESRAGSSSPLTPAHQHLLCFICPVGMHRGAAVMWRDGALDLESEDLSVTITLTLVSDPHLPESRSASTVRLCPPDSQREKQKALCNLSSLKQIHLFLKQWRMQSPTTQVPCADLGKYKSLAIQIRRRFTKGSDLSTRCM